MIIQSKCHLMYPRSMQNKHFACISEVIKYLLFNCVEPVLFELWVAVFFSPSCVGALIHDVIYYCHQQLVCGTVWNRVRSHSTSAFFLFYFILLWLASICISCLWSQQNGAHLRILVQVLVEYKCPIVHPALKLQYCSIKPHVTFKWCFSGWNWNSKI